MAIHRDLSVADNHPIVSAEYATAGDRDNAVLSGADYGKVCRVITGGNYYIFGVNGWVALTDLAGIPDTGWIWVGSGVTLSAGWVNNAFGVRKLGSVVYMRGAIQGAWGAGSSAGMIFTLPAGFYPVGYWRMYGVPHADGDVLLGVAGIKIAGASVFEGMGGVPGDVRYTGASAIPQLTMLSFDGVSYTTD